MPESATPVQNTQTPPGKLTDLLTVPFLLLAALCFFFPLAELNCGPMQARFSGVNLAVGTEPSANGLSPRERKDLSEEVSKKGLLNPGLLLIPVVAIVGVLLLLCWVIGPDPKLPEAVLIGAPLLLVLVFLYYTAAGFGIERDLAREIAESRGQQPFPPPPVTIAKTGWFYAGLGASLAALVLTALRQLSPSVAWRDGQLVIFRGPPVVVYQAGGGTNS